MGFPVDGSSSISCLARCGATACELSGIKAIEVCKGKLHVQPLLASGINKRPPAGIVLIQQPGRLTKFTLAFFPVARLHIVGFPARKKSIEEDADKVPQP